LPAAEGKSVSITHNEINRAGGEGKWEKWEVSNIRNTRNGDCENSKAILMAKLIRTHTNWRLLKMYSIILHKFYCFRAEINYKFIIGPRQTYYWGKLRWQRANVCLS